MVIPVWLASLVLAIGAVSSTDINEMLQQMTLVEKIGQMVQLDIQKFLIPGTANVNYTMLSSWIHDFQPGSMLNCPFSGGPINGETGWNATQWREFIIEMQTIADSTRMKIPIIFGVDSIHGATYVRDAALFPQALGVAASFDTRHAYNTGKIASKDTRAAAIPWIFAPVLGLSLHPLWARFEETFGEDMHLAAEMGTATITGIQDVVEDGGKPTRAAACMKHFIAYSLPENGHDRSPVMLPDRVLRQLYIPSFKAAIDAGVMSAMESYNEVGGVPMASSSEYLKTLLRAELNFTGMMVTDYAEIENLHSWHRVADTQRNAVKISMADTTIDMSMVPNDSSFNEHLLSLVQSGEIPESRVDESVLRILRMKDELGMFDQLIPDLDDVNVATVGQDSDWESALEAARGGITLVKNDNNVLPLSVDTKVFVTGPTCDSLAAQSGSWSLHWQGAQSDDEFSRGVSVLQGMQSLFTSVDTLPGPAVDAADLSGVNMTDVLLRANQADSVVICVGEGTYAEKPGDIDDLSLPQGQLDYVTSIQAGLTGGQPIVLVIVSGRPRLLHSAVVASTAVLNSYRPGPVGGQAVAEIIAGAVVPSGRQPYNYPRNAGDIPYPYHHKPGDQCVSDTGAYVNCEVEWEFGHGLSYTNFTYADMTLSAATMDESGSIDAQITIYNTGSIAANHSVLMFVYDKYRRVTPEYKLLKKFAKYEFSPEEGRIVTFTITAKNLEYVGIDSRYILEGGDFSVSFGADVDCRSTDPADWESVYGGAVTCADFTLTLSTTYNPVCDYGCALWNRGVCGVSVGAEDCATKCVDEAWTMNYVDCLEQYVETSCAGSEAIQCYDAFSMNVPPVDETDSDDSGHSTTFVIILTVCVGIASLILGAVLSAVSFRHIYRKSLRKPLLSGFDADSSAGLMGNVVA